MKRVVFVGAGNVANSLAKAVAKLPDMNLIQIYSKSLTAAQQLAVQIESDTEVLYTANFSDIDPTADIYFFAIKDDVLPKVISKVNTNIEALHLHTAGSHTLDIFGPQKPHCGVFYPFQTFSKSRTLDFSDIPIFIESFDPVDYNSIYGIASQLSTQVYEFNADTRRFLHLAGVFANNFANAMFIQAQYLLEQAQLPPQVLMPLIRETVEKLNVMPALQAQTGPAARHDLNIIEKHIGMLEQPLQKQIYSLISEQIIQWTSQPI